MKLNTDKNPQHESKHLRRYRKAVKQASEWELSSAERLVLIAIASRDQNVEVKDSKGCYKSINKLATETGLHHRTVTGALRLLQRFGLIRHDGWVGQVSRYRLTDGFLATELKDRDDW